MKTRILLLTSLIILSAAIPILSQETQPISSAAVFAPIQAARNGESTTNADDVCEQRLLKVLDALEKAEKTIGFFQLERESRQRLDAANAELLKIKDLIIAEQTKLIELLRNEKKGSKVWRVLKKIASYAEKILLIYIGVQAGRGL